MHLSILFPISHNMKNALSVLRFILTLAVHLGIRQRPVVTKRLSCSSADVHHLAYILVVKPITQPFVRASICQCSHLCYEAIEARQQFLVGTALN